MKRTISIVMLFALLAVTRFSFAQDKTEIEDITKYLESTIVYNGKLIISSTSQKVLASDIIKSELIFNTHQRNSRTIITEHYFIKSGDNLTPYKTLNDMLSSNEFIESIKTKKFKLNTEEDCLAFQAMLKLIDYERGLGFFREKNVWYFIRSKFFDDVEAYVISTDEKGQIASVVYEEKLKKDVSKILQELSEASADASAAVSEAASAVSEATPVTTSDQSAMSGAVSSVSEAISNVGNVGNSVSKKPIIFKKDSTYMHNYLRDNLNYVFEISPKRLESVNKISTISIFKCALKITDEVAILRDPFLLVVNNDEYIKQPLTDDVLKMPLFLKSLEEKYKINTEEDALLFQNLLDDLSLFRSDFDNEVKTFYKKETMWFFIRKKYSDNLKGYIVLVDKKHKVSYIEYTTISDENIARIKNNSN